MTETSWHINKVGVINERSIIREQIGIQNNYPQKQNLTETAFEIQQLLNCLSQVYPMKTDAQKQVIATEFKKEVEQKPELRARIIAALQSGGVEALKQLCNHPAAEVAIATYEGWSNHQ
ncbi:hypothetical protein [Nostoc parmelioides]|uniref:HEAT repeat domain-containing protein n=1 Tax=Nostoc parmelioides FACHB-3921 TaxID=2692909 RepID=A0ABR8BK27_9NOSO|nr:hypothetical protein [Nostoc parmelioides]MBD2254442.1 hypothetical protein [Nostoc parmelioides FACHB-3921]